MDFAVLPLLIEPSKAEPDPRLKLSVDIESTYMLPETFWFLRASVTLPPLEPELPQESACILRKYPSGSLFTMVLFSSVMEDLVFVT